MKKHKKLVVAAVVAGVLLLAGLGGIALADEGDDPADRSGEFIDRVIANYEDAGYTIESPEALQQAFADAREELCQEKAEMRAVAMENRPAMDPEARQEHLDALLAEEKITQEQYDKIMERLESMPEDFPGFGPRGHGRFPGGFGPCPPPAEE